jgi:ATP-dependent protease HslVU (ClpYQ) peptidase subunit
MTTIVTTVSDTHAVMLGDQGITSDLKHPDMNKIVNRGTWLIGVSGDSRICDILQYEVTYPRVPKTLLTKPNSEWYKWIVTRIIPRMADVVDKKLHKSYRGTIGDSEALLTTHGRSFLIDELLGVSRTDPFWAIGSGSHLALGSLNVMSKYDSWNTNHANYAHEAIKSAMMHDPYSRGAVSGYRSDINGRISKVITE